MDTLLKQEPVADLRDNLGEERTFLAWVRTHLADGFRVCGGTLPDFRGRVPYRTARLRRPAHGLSLWLGTVLIAVGVVVNLFSARRHMRLAGELRRAHVLSRHLSEQGVIVALIVALLGIAMAIYMKRSR